MMLRRLRSLIVSIGLLSLAGLVPAWGDQTITLDGRREGRRFDGIGAVSGGGATSRFLIEYPEPQRSQILDYLFKPNFGAAMQVLYVEIGSDKNGTQGSEPAFARSRQELDHPTPECFQRGYEWWLMKEARRRNPAIRFDATAWNSPLWVGSAPGGGGFWSQDMCDYYAGWIKGAKTYHGLDVNYTGCRNESGVNVPWIKLYRKTLDREGLKNVVIHGFDNWRPELKWTFTEQFATDPELDAAVGIVSNHTIWKGSAEKGYAPPPAHVLKSGKPIWDTEEHVYQDGFASALNKVRSCNEGYIDARITSKVFWHLISAFYKLEGWYGKHAMAIASSPWSGNYTLMPELWGHAHTCQFSKIGWHYLEGEACGYLQGGGSFVTYRSPDGDYSIVIETKNAKADQGVTFKIAGGLSAGKLSVWKSDPKAMFQRQEDLAPRDGAITVTLKPSAIYTLSTLAGQQKGEHPAPPAEKPFPFPYHENYDHYAKTGTLPYYHSDIHGVFEVADRPDGAGKCVRAVVKFVRTKTPLDGFTVLGDAAWKDYQVCVDVSLTDDGAAALLGRVSDTRGKNLKGYVLKLQKSGAWELLAATRSLASGQVKLADRPWHNLKLVFQGDKVRALVDGLPVAAVDDATFPAGMIGLGTCMSGPAFDNLIVSEVDVPLPPPTVFFQDTTPNKQP